MEETEAPRAIVDVREDTVFCPFAGTKQGPKTCYFLRPSYMECVGGAQVPEPPPVVHSALSSLFDGRGRDLPLRTKFRQQSYHSKGWVEWVCLMEPLHRETWEKVGIFEAIKCSTYRVVRDSGLLIALAEKWCCDTNTFVFSWGEATITLEDVYVLGGYPVQGSPIFTDVDDGELWHVEERMIFARWEICRGPSRSADSGSWMKMFKGSGNDIEHEAFLAFWLSRFVFMMPQARISVNVFPIAARLARGHKIALAPAVLASIYRDLSLAAKVMHGLTAPRGSGDIRVWLRSNVLQVWMRERFIVLQTRPKVIGFDEPRISRWDGVRNLTPKQALMDQDMNISNCFEWRPYVKDVENFKRPGFYPEEGRMDILVGDNVKDEIWMFARFLVPCELVGIDCIEQYLPHRVALQFGMDQDIPGHVARCNENPQVAWETYDISFCNSSLYIPPRYYKPGMNERYHNWLGSRALEGPAERSKEAAEEGKYSFPPGFPPVPPIRDVGEANGEDDDDHMTLSRLLSKTRKCIAVRSRASDCDSNLSKNNKGVASSGNASSTDPATGFDVALDEEPKGESTPTDPNPKEEAAAVENNDTPSMNPIREQEIPRRTAWRSRSTFEVDMLELELSARISQIRRDVAAIKAARQMRQLMASQRGNER